MEIGQIVRSISGHDKNRFYVVTGTDKDSVTIADGKIRRLSKPKKKNIRHVAKTNEVLDLSKIMSDKALYLILKEKNVKLKTLDGGNLLG